ncbi:MAG: nucleotidyltransferase domain-containing protein [Candidatus Neomarinimicrobiota bacterium]
MKTLQLILSSKIRAELFRIFFGLNDTEIHLRGIERATGFAIGTVRRETDKLVETGLLSRRSDGNRTYFSVNKTHPLYRDIRNIVLKTTGLVDVIKQPLVNEPIQFAFLFGSIATDNLTPDSDIDLLVIGEIGLRQITASLKDCSSQIGREINVVSMTLTEFKNKKSNKDHFISRILLDPKIMIIGNENELAGLGQ